MVSFYIDSIFQNDSFKVDGSWNNHEGINFTTYFMKAQKPNHLKTNLQDFEVPSNYFELGLDHIDKETVLTLLHYNKSNKLLDSIQFTKILDKQKGFDPIFGLQYFVNHKIISGNYVMTDDKKVSTKVTFNFEGTVAGLPNAKNFYITTDFIAGPTPKYDQLILDLSQKTQQSFILKSQRNYFDLFTNKGDADEETIEPVKIKYHFVKQ